MTSHGNQHTFAPAGSKRRILFVITRSEVGGAQQFLKQLLTHIDRNILECAIAAGSEGAHALKTIIPEDIRYMPLKHLVRNPNILKDARAIFELKNIVLSYRPHTLFLISSKAGFIGALAAQLAKGVLPKLSVVYRIGGWTFNDPWPSWKKVIYRMLEKVSARWKDYIIVNNAADLRLAQHYGIRPRHEVLLIHNGIDPYMEFYDREQARLKLSEFQPSLLGAASIVGTIANFYPSKDIVTFVRAAAQLPEHVLACVIGDGPLRNDIQAEIQRLELEKRVFLPGALKDAWRYLPAFDVFALASRKEGFPWVVLEAIAAKVPVVATRVGAVPELIKHETHGLIVDPATPAQLTRAIDRLLKDERLGQDLALHAHQRLVKDFSLLAMVRRYEELFSRP